LGTLRRGWFVLLAGVLLAAAVAGAASQASDAGRAALPELSIADASGTNRQTGTSKISFPVTLSAPSVDTVTVDYRTVPGTADEDFEPAAGTLAFAPGETSKAIDVTLLPEPGTTTEPDEDFAVVLSNPVNATIARGTAAGTVHFDGNPLPGQVNVETAGTGTGQCVKTVNTAGCVPLTGEVQLNVSDIQFVDPGKGIVALQSTAGKARFYGTPFTLKETVLNPKSKRPVLLLQLIGGNFSACRAAAPKAFGGTRSTTLARKSKKTVRRLFGHGNGRFRTKGRYSAGTVRGTFWVTVDRCDGTLTQVFFGVVSVHDLVLNRYVKVRAGQKYLASPSKKKKKK